MRQTGIYKSHDIMIYISWSADLRPRPDIKIKTFVVSTFLSYTDGSK